MEKISNATVSQPNPVCAIPLQSTSLDIWESKYRLKTKDGKAIDETIDDTYQRVAKALAELESDSKKWQKEFLWALRHGAIPLRILLWLSCHRSYYYQHDDKIPLLALNYFLVRTYHRRYLQGIPSLLSQLGK